MTERDAVPPRGFARRAGAALGISPAGITAGARGASAVPGQGSGG